MKINSGPQRELYIEAVRIVPAVSAAKVQNRMDDVLELYKGFMEEAKIKNVPRDIAWSMLAAAGSVWVNHLVALLADAENRYQQDLVFEMVEQAQGWVTSGAV